MKLSRDGSVQNVVENESLGKIAETLSKVKTSQPVDDN